MQGRIVVIDDGINISVIGVCGWQHPKFDWDKYKLLLVPKVRGHISDKEEGSSKSIFVNLEHFSNSKGSMDITEDGIVIFSNDEQEEKEYFSMDLTLLGISIWMFFQQLQ